MRVEENHAHATTRYKPISDEDYPLLVKDILEVVRKKYQSLTVHLPFQVQHPDTYPDLQIGLDYIDFGEVLKNYFNISLYWENAPEEVYGEWNLKYGQTSWINVPTEIDLCLDTGHLMMDCKDIVDAQTRIESILKKRGRQIKHVHIHENDLTSDQHLQTRKILTRNLLEKLQKNRTFIFEKGE